jgi:tRNA(adenine34) deaminase
MMMTTEHRTRVNWDKVHMARAIEIARHAEHLGHRPFGCVITDEMGHTVAESFGSELPTDPTRHSEVLAIQEACRIKKGLLYGCTIYSTHEPCIMCCGAILHSHISRVLFGSYRDDLPALFRERCITGITLLADTSHPPKVIGGILRPQCIDLFAGELSELANARTGF